MVKNTQNHYTGCLFHNLSLFSMTLISSNETSPCFHTQSHMNTLLLQFNCFWLITCVWLVCSAFTLLWNLFEWLLNCLNLQLAFFTAKYISLSSTYIVIELLCWSQSMNSYIRFVHHIHKMHQIHVIAHHKDIPKYAFYSLWLQHFDESFFLSLCRNQWSIHQHHWASSMHFWATSPCSTYFELYCLLIWLTCFPNEAMVTSRISQILTSV